MRILIADDHGIVRSGLRLLLERQDDIEVIAEADDGVEAREKAVERAARPRDPRRLDAALTGLQATHEIKQQAPDVAVLILSMHDDERYLFEALKAGASGYVLKAQADTDLLDAMRAVERGEPFLTPEAQQALIRTSSSGATSREEELTPREEEIVKLVAEAHTNKEIAEILAPLREDGREPSRQRDAEARHARPGRAGPLRDPPGPDRAVSGRDGAGRCRGECTALECPIAAGRERRQATCDRGRPSSGSARSRATGASSPRWSGSPRRTSRYLTEVDHHDHEALVAVDPRAADRRGRPLRARRRRREAEVAVVVGDPWQGRGSARPCSSGWSSAPARTGIDHFVALVLSDNDGRAGAVPRISPPTVRGPAAARSGQHEMLIELPEPGRRASPSPASAGCSARSPASRLSVNPWRVLREAIRGGRTERRSQVPPPEDRHNRPLR